MSGIFIPRNKRELYLRDLLRDLKPKYDVGGNYDVYQGQHRVAYDLTRDQAVGYAMAMQKHASHGYESVWLGDVEVRCNNFVVWPEEQWGIVHGEELVE